MIVLKGLKERVKFDRPVVTIGNFDGLHIGHQRIIEEVKEKAREIGGVSVLVTFDPHPLTLLDPKKIRGLITPLPLKKRILREAGIEVLIILNFDENLRELEPEEFVKSLLVERIGVFGLVLGWDFRFGKGAKGDVDLLQKLSKKYGFFFKKIDPVTLDGEKVGSNRIRKMIEEGDVKRAKDFLGRPFLVTGKVIYGAGMGRKIGFPTANIATYENQLLPKNGVYITEIEFQGRYLPSVTNIGFKPTFGYKKISVETHILGFYEDLYGMELDVIFHQRLRDEKAFNSLDKLKEAITDDVAKAEEFFSVRS